MVGRLRKIIPSGFARGALLFASLAVVLTATIPQALAQCAQNGNNQTCTNPVGTTMPFGINDSNVVTLTNLGVITRPPGTGNAVEASGVNVFNSGTIYSEFSYGILSLTAVHNDAVTNSGSIFGGSWGVFSFSSSNLTVSNTGNIGSYSVGVGAINSLTLTNSGSITSRSYGVSAGDVTITNTGLISGATNYGIVATHANVTNSGTITGATGFAVGAGTGSVLTNSGTIIGTGGTAIDFSLSSADTLNFLPGSRIVGRILLGANDIVNVQTAPAGNSVLTFTPNGAFTLNATFLGTLPYVVNGAQIATLEPTAFGMTDRTLMDFTGNISSLLGSRFSEFASAGSTGANAFSASTSGSAAAAEAAFDGIPGLANSYAKDRSIPNVTAADPASEITVWSKAFAGWRGQDADGTMLASRTVAYGAALGMDKQVRPDLRLGIFLGAGNSRLNVDSNSETVNTDYVFGGVYGRLDRTTHFFDFATTVGHTANSGERTIASNLAPGGFETGKANYDGWFVRPELAYGVHLPLGDSLVLTPTARIRYLAGFIDGYSETGSAQNLTVKSRTVQDIEERFEIALLRVDADRKHTLKTTVNLGFLGIERLGDTTVNTVLIGQNLAFTAPGQSAIFGGYTGVAFDYRISAATNLFAAVEGTAMSDKSWTATVHGGVRVAF